MSCSRSRRASSGAANHRKSLPIIVTVRSNIILVAHWDTGLNFQRIKSRQNFVRNFRGNFQCPVSEIYHLKFSAVAREWHDNQITQQTNWQNNESLETSA